MRGVVRGSAVGRLRSTQREGEAMTNNPYQPYGQSDPQNWPYEEQQAAAPDPYASYGQTSSSYGTQYQQPYPQTAGYVPAPSQPYGYSSSVYAPSQAPVAPVMSVTDWIVTYLISAIPLVGLVMLFVWAFSSTENPNKSNWAKSALILGAIVAAIYLVFVLFVLGVLGASSYR